MLGSNWLLTNLIHLGFPESDTGPPEPVSLAKQDRAEEEEQASELEIRVYRRSRLFRAEISNRS